MERFTHLILDYLIASGFASSTAKALNLLTLLVVSLVIIFCVEYAARFILVKAFNQFAKKTKTKLDDIIVSNKLLKNVAHFIPLYFALKIIPYVFADFLPIGDLVEKGLDLFYIILILWIIKSVLNTLRDYAQLFPNLRDIPLNSYIQVFMIFAWISGFMVGYSYVTGTPIWKFFTVLGAASAVIILIFKDTILGFVASIQVSVNDMVRVGDWITFGKHGADGDVIEITLATVKIQNFDKTITTIPTYALISDSFKNWRGMEDSGGRRIKRALIIKQNSIRYLTEEDLQHLSKIELIAPYLQSRQQEIDKYNTQHGINKEVLVNGRNLTNIGVFQKYADVYLHHHSAINKEMMMMVRQLAPTPQGLPLEIYAFSRDREWKNYEYIMGDIFDHLIAAIPYFNLELFELPDNKDQRFKKPVDKPTPIE